MNEENSSSNSKKDDPLKPTTKPPSNKPKKVKKPKVKKMTLRLRREIDLTTTKIDGIVRHIRNVQDNCVLLGEKLIKTGQVELGRNLIKNGFEHDTSKFSGIEWEHMAPGTPMEEKTAKLKLKMAIHHHNTTNEHHPEYWGSIHLMPRIYLAEMVCDWKARSEEFGSSLRDWITSSASKRFDFTDKDPVHKVIFEFVDLLCEKPFAPIAAP